MTHDHKLILRSAASGVLSYALVAPLNDLFHAQDLGQVLPGLLFGGLAIGPEIPKGPRRFTHWSLSIILGAVLYSGAMKLAVHLITERHWKDLPACALAGFLGAIAVGLLCRVLTGKDVTPQRLTRAAVAGLLTGAVFGLKGTFGIPSDLEVCTLVAGFVAWQTTVAWTVLKD